MRFRRTVLLTAVFVLVTPVLLLASPRAQSPAPQFPAPVATTDVPSLTNELDRISDLLDKKPSPDALTDLRNSLPNQWTVNTPERTYTISTDYLRNQLSAGKADDARAWSVFLSKELHGYTIQDSSIPVNSRAELDRILAGPEFAAVHPPTSWDIFRQRLAAWLGRQFERLFSRFDRYPIGGQILFWVIIAVAVGFIALSVFRFLASRDRVESMPPQEIIAVYRTWQEWIRAARAAAVRNDFREAIHSAYWAGITRLQDADVLPKDTSKTPREYLRSLSEPSKPGSLSPTTCRGPLSVLTSRLEQIWYGNRRAASEDFSDSLRQLESLGCHLD
jgi:hypothetical protein